ncbi:MAG: uroporphyrinogen-III synthase [Vicinamibacteria bacterium]
MGADFASLRGRCVLVTRPREQVAELAEGLRRRGAQVVEAPVIRIEGPTDLAPMDAAILRLPDFDWVVFTSANGVRSFLERMRTLDRVFPRSRPKIAAIGSATAAVLRSEGIRVDLLPERFVAEEVFEALKQAGPLQGRRVLLPRADIAREALPELLRAAGAEVEVVVAYKTVTAAEEISRALDLVRDGRVDVVTFTSGSTVRSFLSAVRNKGELRGKFASASIGPITSRALRDAGFEPDIEASVYTVDGLIAAIERYFSEEKEPGRHTPLSRGKTR